MTERMSKKSAYGPTIRSAGTEDIENVREFLQETSHLYPDIEGWFDAKVVPGLGQERVLHLAEDNDKLAGVFIGKRGKGAKLCSLRVRDEAQHRGIGPALVASGLADTIRPHTKDITVTISAAAGWLCRAFFERIGFRRVAVENERYVRGVDEFVYGCSANDMQVTIAEYLQKFVSRTLFGMHVVMPEEEDTPILLMSLKPEYADMILGGKKTVEFRRRFSEKYQGSRIMFYVSSPVQKLSFCARVGQVDHKRTDSLWEDNRETGGIQKDTFQRYFDGTEHGYAIHLEDVTKLSRQIGLSEVKSFSPGWRPPQSFQKLPSDSTILEEMQLPG